MARTSKHTPNERLYRKRLAARLRQRRCRERKRVAAMVSKQTNHDEGSVVKSTSSASQSCESTSGSSSSTPTRVRIVHVPVPCHQPPVFRGMPHYPPMYMPHPAAQGPPMMCMPPCAPMPPMHAPYYPPYPGMMGHPHCPPPRMQYHPAMSHHGHPGNHPHHIPRVVSRSASEASMDYKVDNRHPGTPPRPIYSKREDERQTIDTHTYAEYVPKRTVTPQKKRTNPLASSEKTAVAAILSLKTSSDDECSDESSSTDDAATCTAVDQATNAMIPSNMDHAFREADSNEQPNVVVAAV